MILAATLVLLLAVPASAHIPVFLHRETGSNECSASLDVHTEIKAEGHHMHERVGVSSAIYHFPLSAVRYTSNHDWNVVAMEWKLYNESGGDFIFSSSFGTCGS